MDIRSVIKHCSFAGEQRRPDSFMFVMEDIILVCIVARTTKQYRALLGDNIKLPVRRDNNIKPFTFLSKLQAFIFYLGPYFRCDEIIQLGVSCWGWSED